MFTIISCIWSQSIMSGMYNKQSETKVKVAIYVQLIFGPLRCDGIGLSDRETMERLWSFLRPFNKMTKEMRPSHRIDILTHALVYY